MGEPKAMSLEALSLASFVVVKSLIAMLVASKQFSAEQIQAMFESAKQEFHRTTLTVSPDEADQLFALFWSGYAGGGRDEKPH